VKDKVIDQAAGRKRRQAAVERLNRADAAMIANAANELVIAGLCGDPEYPDYLRALIEVLREVGLADS